MRLKVAFNGINWWHSDKSRSPDPHCVMILWLNGSWKTRVERNLQIFFYLIYLLILGPNAKRCKPKKKKEGNHIFICVQSEEVTGNACVEKSSFPRTLSNIRRNAFTQFRCYSGSPKTDLLLKTCWRTNRLLIDSRQWFSLPRHRAGVTGSLASKLWQVKQGDPLLYLVHSKLPWTGNYEDR